MQKTKKERMKSAGQGLLATGVALGIGGVYTGHSISLIFFVIFMFFGTMFYTASRLEDTEENKTD